jgi:hypothetical protein
MLKTRYLQHILWLIIVLGKPGSLVAEVKDSSAVGFTIQDTLMISAPPLEAYHALVADIGSWWDPMHTFSGDANNLSLDDKAGGCFCEKLKNGGSVRHLEVVFADPGKTLRMIGGLGPLQAMAVSGSMTWLFSKTDDGSMITLIYSVSGYRFGGLQNMAPLVDKVMVEQLKRLKEFIEKKKNE